MLTHGSLFSGIDGFGYAADLMKWQNVFHCEINPILQQFLKKLYPNAQSYNDITTTDFTFWRGRIDILTGGFPCQPYSMAGKRKGTDDERHLWPQMLRAIREIQPPWIVGENVRGIINWSKGLVFHEVQTDLENEGYEVQSFLLPASGVNAPHERYRTWFIAYSNEYRNSRNASTGNIKKENTSERSNVFFETCGPGTQQTFTNSNSVRCIECEKQTNQTGFDALCKFERGDCYRNDSNSNASRCKKHIAINFTEEKIFGSELDSEQRKQIVTNANSIGRNKTHRHGKAKQFDENFTEFNWRNFPTQSPVCDGNDGISAELLRTFIIDNSNGLLTEKEVNKIISKTLTAARNETIKAGGNAVVPQVVLQLFKAIQDYENLLN